MKASQCDECVHHTLKWYRYRGSEPFDVLTCGKGHKPRFYLPRSPLDFNFGWKKACGDFRPSNASFSREPERSGGESAGSDS